MGADDSIEIDIEGWLSPAKALESLPVDWDIETRKRWIYRRLASGQIRAIASQFRQNSQTNSGGATIIAARFWNDPWRKFDHDFWETSDITITDAPPLSNVMIFPSDTVQQPEIRIDFFDVLFDPTGFPIRDDDEDTGVDAIASEEMTPLAVAEARRYLTAYVAAFGDGVVEAKALAATRAAYPENSISREKVRELLRELRGPGKPGKPVIRGK